MLICTYYLAYMNVVNLLPLLLLSDFGLERRKLITTFTVRTIWILIVVVRLVRQSDNTLLETHDSEIFQSPFMFGSTKSLPDILQLDFMFEAYLYKESKHCVSPKITFFRAIAWWNFSQKFSIKTNWPYFLVTLLVEYILPSSTKTCILKMQYRDFYAHCCYIEKSDPEQMTCVCHKLRTFCKTMKYTTSNRFTQNKL